MENDFILPGVSGFRKQPVAEIFGAVVYVQSNNTYRSSDAVSYTNDFSVSGSVLTCQRAGTYRVFASASFRYGYFYVKVNGQTRLTVDGSSIGGGGIATADGNVTLAKGDTVSCEAVYTGSQTRFTIGDANIFRN